MCLNYLHVQQYSIKCNSHIWQYNLISPRISTFEDLKCIICKFILMIHHDMPEKYKYIVEGEASPIWMKLFLVLIKEIYKESYSKF